MEENTRDGENTETSAGTRQSGQQQSNDTMNGRPDLHPEANHSHARKARPSQCEYVVQKICLIQKIDKRYRLVNHDEQQRDLTTIP